MKRITLLFLLFISVSVFAQEDRGRITGLVADPSGAVIPKATVALRNEGTDVVITRMSDGGGVYVFELLNPGLYTVEVTAAGFRQYRVEHVRVEVASSVGVNAKLTVGEATAVVTVTESGGASLKTEDAILGYTVEARSATDLPILYSNPFELQLFAPGVVSTTLATGNHTYEGGSESSKVDGAQSARTEFSLDGAPETRNGGAVTTAYIPSREFLGEFKLITSPYDASLSHTSGGSLDASLKSGTSAFHGSADIFIQPPAVDAHGFALGGVPGIVPVSRYHREAGEVTGPIIRNKLFFFTGYEHQYNKAAASSSTMTVPTAAEKNGDFSALLAQGSTITTSIACVVNKVNQYVAPYNQYQLFNPYSGTQDPRCPTGVIVRQPILGNIVTNVQAIDPIAKKILSYYPDPTPNLTTATSTGLNNYLSGASNNDYYWSEASRVDYDMSNSQKLFGHVIYSHRIQPGKNEYFPGASGQTTTLVNKAAILDYVNTLNPTTLLDVRYSYTRFQSITSLTATTTSTDLGVNASALAGANPLAAGFPQVKASGYATLGNSDPAYEFDNVNVGAVSLSKSLGRHQLRFGVEFRQYQANQANLTQEHLSISASGKYTTAESAGAATPSIGPGVAALELGQAESTQMTLNAATANNTDYWSGFIQDDWKATPNLAINVGLRYEYGSPISERHGKSITGFAFNTPNPIAAAAMANYAKAPSALLPVAGFQVNGGLTYADTAASPSNLLWNAQKKNFSPRVGFAYTPTPKLVVRGGFGIFYDHLGEYIQYGNPLGYTQQTTTVPTLDNGLTFQASLANPFPNGLVQPSGNANGLEQGLGTSITFFIQNPKTPYNERFSFGFQYQLPSDIIFEATYVGNIGQHIRITRDYNPLPDQYLSTDTTRTAAQVTNAAAIGASCTNPYAGIVVPGSSSLTGSTVTCSQLLKPYSEFSGITAGEESGFSTYNALQLLAQKRFTHGYNLSVAYTQSRALDAITFLNPGDKKPWYGVSNGDYPAILSVAGIYELPFGKNKMFFSNAPGYVQAVIRGFQIQGTYRVQSGQPISLGVGSAILRPGHTLADLGKWKNRNVNEWFDRATFINARTDVADQGVDEDGNCNLFPLTCYANTSLESNLVTAPLRLNNVRQDYQDLLNVGAIKRFIVHDRFDTTLRAEAINALNHPVFSAPSASPSSTTWGQITGFGNTARVLQFALEVHF
jgi:Carboxypeptidase regulatory-like domain/TonB dependent receptor